MGRREYTEVDFFQQFPWIPLSRKDLFHATVEDLLKCNGLYSGVSCHRCIGITRSSFEYNGKPIEIEVIPHQGEPEKIVFTGDDDAIAGVLKKYGEFLDGTNYLPIPEFPYQTDVDLLEAKYDYK